MKLKLKSFNPFKFLNLPAFFISLFLGFFVVKVMTDPTRTIIVYPTPDNRNQLQHKDRAGSCFSFNQTEVKCPTDEKQIYQIPVQN